MKLRQLIFLLTALSMVALLVGCSSSSTKTPPPAITVAISPAAPASLQFGASTPLTAVVNNDSAAGGVSWTATCGSADCGGFSATTTPSGTATTYTAPAVIPSGNTVTVTATSVTDATKKASAVITITGPSPLADGTYVFSLSGQNTAGNYVYYVAGAFKVGGGLITGGEQDFIDYSLPLSVTDSISNSGSSITPPDAAGNLTIILNTGDSSIGVGGVETLSVVMATSGTAGFITESDSSASGSGNLLLQSLPSSGSGLQSYAFFVNGGDANGFASGMGGVVNVDGAGGVISGGGSVFDLDDGGTLTQGAPIDSGTVMGPDTFGRVTISLVLSTSGVGGIGLAGYIVDSNRVFLVENSNDANDIFFGVTGGIAYTQTSTGTFNAASIEGTSFVFGTNGQNPNNYLQVAGVVTTNLDGTTVSGTLNSNDLTGTFPTAPVPFTGTYTVDSTGRVTLSNLASTDGTTFSGITLQLYLSGGSNVAVNAMDLGDEWAGPAKVQTGGGSFTAGSLSGNYGLVTTGFGLPGGFAGPETDSVGFFTADGVSAFNPGAVDQNILFGAQTGDVTFTGAFSADPSGVFTGTITGLDIIPANQDIFSYYLIDATAGVAIETDANQLTLGLFNLE
jgi:hypothetical protein